MTKKHFIAFANRIKSDLEETQRRFPAQYKETVKACTYAASLFAALAQEDNPRFDCARFMKACGL